MERRDDAPLTWRKSSRSGNNGGACVELADAGGAVGIRDSKAPEQGHVEVSRTTFRTLIEAIKTTTPGS